MNNQNILLENQKGDAKKSLLFYRKNLKSANSSENSRRCKTPDDLLKRTLNSLDKNKLLQNQKELENFKELERFKDYETMTEEISRLKFCNDRLKSHNQEIVEVLIEVIEVLTKNVRKNDELKKNLLFEIKTSVISKLEEIKEIGIDYIEQIKKVCLWGNNENHLGNNPKNAKNKAVSLHPLNPFKKIFQESSVKAIADYKGKTVRFI